MTKRIVGLVVALAATMAVSGAVPASAGGTPKFTLNVVHGIPGVTVDVCVNGDKAIRDFQPGDVVSGVRLPEGEYRLKVTPAGKRCGASARCSSTASYAGKKPRSSSSATIE